MRLFVSLGTWLALTLTWHVLALAGDKLWLVRDGGARAVIVRGGEDDFAAERLQAWLKRRAGVEVGIRVADQKYSPEEPCVVLVGSPATNALIRKLAAEAKIELDVTKLGDQGYVARLRVLKASMR